MAGRRRAFLLLMAAPAVVFVVAVALWPVLQGVQHSLWDYDLRRPARAAFVGLENYRDLWADPAMRRAFVNTLVFTLAAVAIELVLGFLLALALWPDSALSRACLAFVLAPLAITPLAVGLLFRALLEPDYGMLGYWARAWGLSPAQGFLGHEATALASLIVIDVWQWTPLMALMLLAGLKTLPRELAEAAAIDGASGPAFLRRIVLPLMLPAILLALVIRAMDAFKIYDSVLAATGGGPGDATNVLMFHAVKLGLEFFQMGQASAVSTVMLLCIAVLATGFILLLSRQDRA